MQPIKKLDAQLANQIAAGEVVERPASVVKELLENSLDAGARRIDIEITAGGCGLIRIRDDGSGIPKQQLKLALSAHATSKISSLDDLDVISSFGFRGEALSSISSVSRFTLSSRTKASDQGWQAEAEGRDMKIKLTPVAVTEGTRIDVRELFFNTPARRRFLRTEKTEFSHIEEVVRKVALANFTVAITLKHNSKMVRRFRAAGDLAQQEQRVAAVCGRQFMQHSIRLDLEHEGIQLSGWLALPDYHRSQTDGQYFYVNNRPVKDRVLNHAIRQAYQNFIPEGRVPAYVLYLILDPRKVDVNVHPTKHEVRFHDARLIHDLLVQAIEQGLAEGKQLVDGESLQVRKNYQITSPSNQVHAATNPDDKQHQAYRTLLQSVSNTSISKGVAEVPQLNIPDWHYLTRINDEFVLLEKNQQLVLLSIDVLLQAAIKQGKQQLNSRSQKLLFPEIIQCLSSSDATILNETLQQISFTAEIFESQITILQIPEWVQTLPVQTLVLEISRVFSRQAINIQPVAPQQIANLVLALINRCDDKTDMQLKMISMDRLVELFNDC